MTPNGILWLLLFFGVAFMLETAVAFALNGPLRRLSRAQMLAVVIAVGVGQVPLGYYLGTFLYVPAI